MNKVRDGIIGVAIGDMLGVPVEGVWREYLHDDPVTGLREYGTHDQPKGTWSDDTSLTLCLADSLIRDFNLEDIAKTFLRWKIDGEWTPFGRAFDIGRQTNDALNNLYSILESGDSESLRMLHYEADEKTNGNGSLMRILPMYFYLQGEVLEEKFDDIWEVSALTHPHVRSALACLMYLIMLQEMESSDTLRNAYLKTAKRMREFINEYHIEELSHFDRLIENDISELPKEKIKSGAYVIDTLEASFWCLLNTKSYKEAVLKAVNLGYDTDTTAAVTGGIAGMWYGIDTVPVEWYESVVRISDIEELCDQLHQKFPDKSYEPSPLVRFLLGEGKDFTGRTLNDVLAMTDEDLEKVHDYIQWLFPLREGSAAVWDAPTLNSSDIAYITTNPVARENIATALERLHAFYMNNDHWIQPYDHNYKRITRILMSTRVLLGKDPALAFYEHISARVQSKNVVIEEESVEYWRKAVGITRENS